MGEAAPSPEGGAGMERSRAMRLIWIVAVLYSGTLLPPPGASAQPLIPPPSSIALLPKAVLASPGKTLDRLRGYDPNRVLLFRSNTDTFNAPELPSVPGTPSAVALSSTGRNLAIATDIGVSILGLDEYKIVQTLPPAALIRWSLNGQRLAMLAASSSADLEARTQLTIWDVGSSSPTTYEIKASDLDWGPGDSLFLVTEKGVEALAPGAHDLVPTRHGGVSVSPDSRYSVRRDRAKPCGYTITHDRSGIDLTECTLNELGKVSAPNMEVSPFWLRNPGVRHVLCVSRGGTWARTDSVPPIWATRTGNVDVATTKLTYATPGIAVGAAADGGGAWVYDGYTLGFIPASAEWRSTWRTQKAYFDVERVGFPPPNTDKLARSKSPPKLSLSKSPPRVDRSTTDWHASLRLRVALISSSRGIAWRPEVREMNVEEGDFLPSWRNPNSGCRRLVRVVQVFRDSTLDLQVDPTEFVVKLPGADFRHLARFEVGKEPVTIQVPNLVRASEGVEFRVLP